MLDPIAFSIGSHEIRWYGVIIATSFALGIFLAYEWAKRENYNTDHLVNLIIWVIPCAIIGARLYFVIFEWDYYILNPQDILAIWEGGLAIHGGLLGGVIAGLIYTLKYKLDFWQTTDILAPSIAIGQALGRWGNFFNQEAHGGVISSHFISFFPEFIQKQMLINGNYYHPTFLYESLWNIMVFIILTLAWKKRQFTGQITLLYIMLYSFARFWIEGLRTDSLMLGNFKVAQLISIFLILLGIIVWVYLAKRRSLKNNQ